jgi:hypothetical protein
MPLFPGGTDSYSWHGEFLNKLFWYFICKPIVTTVLNPKSGPSGNALPSGRAQQCNHLVRKRAGQTGGAAQTSPPISGLAALQMPLVMLMEFDLSGPGNFNPLFNALVCFVLGHAKTPNLAYCSMNRPAS